MGNCLLLVSWKTLGESLPVPQRQRVCSEERRAFLGEVRRGAWQEVLDDEMGEKGWSGAQQPTPIFLPGEFHGQRSLAGYSP